MVDLFASFGWNGGKRRPTKSEAVSAWWLGRTEGSGGISLEDRILQHITNTYNTNGLVIQLWDHIKQHIKQVPCQVEPKDPNHRLWVKRRKPFALYCCVKGCKGALSAGNAERWFANLVVNGILPWEAIGMEEEEQIEATPQPIQTLSLPFRPNAFAIPPLEQLHRVNVTPVMLKTNWNLKDGNCMFSAFAKAFKGEQLSASKARDSAVMWGLENSEFLDPFIDGDNPTKVEDYLLKMSRKVLKKAEDGTFIWMKLGDNATLDHPIPLYLESEHYENLVQYDEVLGSN
ncbi:hypothetical protein IAR55_007203 [Kwoniella newhampshirensis]|uniref:OTU domain-containing protein n=1 Tax=Kwoniella newhampshirensis TaxID=1651941 RepID=A0AAW0YT41_9TREE